MSDEMHILPHAVIHTFIYIYLDELCQLGGTGAPHPVRTVSERVMNEFAQSCVRWLAVGTGKR